MCACAYASKESCLDLLSLTLSGVYSGHKAREKKMTVLVISTLYGLIYLCIHCQAQEVPYVSFNGTNLTNHSYLDLTLVGNMNSTSVSCHTNVVHCCSGVQGPYRGDWYFPNGLRLPFSNRDITESRSDRRVELRRNNGNASGIYYCNIAIRISSNPTARGFIYIGLYASGGDLSIRDALLLQDVKFNEVSPQFTLICSSTGGPATTVTWTRDSEIVSVGTSTVLEDAVTAEYTHTLTVTGRLGGYYQCIVSNNKPSNASSHFTVQVASTPEDLTLTQHGLMNITVSWTPPTPLNYTNGYRVYYKPNQSSSWQNITINNTSNTTVNLTGLTSRKYYNISIVSLSHHLPSEMRQRDIYLVSLPKKPTVTVSSRTATTLLLAIYPLPEENYPIYVTWEKTYPICSHVNSFNYTIINVSPEYSIAGLDEGSSYSVTVTVTNIAGNTISDPINEVTLETAPSAPPQDIQILSMTTFTITVGWHKVTCIHCNGNITGYKIVYNTKDSDVICNISVSKNNVTISDLQSDREYFIRVAAENDAGVGVYGSITAKTLQFEVMVLSITSSTIELTWSEAGSIGHDIDITWTRSNLSQCPYYEEENSYIARLSAHEQNTTIFGLDVYTIYTIRVFVRDSTNVIDVTTNASVLSATPTKLSYIDSTASSITIQWEEVPCVHRNGIITGYMIKWKDGERGLVYNTTNGKQREAEITGLEPSTQYEIQVAAVNSAGIGPFTSTSLIANTSAPSTTPTDPSLTTTDHDPSLMTTTLSVMTTITSQAPSEREQDKLESSVVIAIVAGVIISLLLIVVGISVFFTGVLLWRRQTPSQKCCEACKNTQAAMYEEVGVTREVKRSHDIELTSNEAYAPTTFTP